MKILCIINICGLSERNNDAYYIKSIQSILDQSFDDFKVVVSSCLNNQWTIDNLLETFGQKISINWIKDRIPVNCSFNFSALKAIKKFGSPECGVLYIDSGCHFQNQTNILSEIYKLWQTKKYGLITIRTDTNTGFPSWYNIGTNDNDSKAFNKYFRNLSEHFIIPIGKCCNMHCTLFSSQLIDYYKKPFPDIFAGESSESCLGNLTAAINLKWIIHKDIEIHHEISTDGPSFGFSPWKWIQDTGRQTYDHPFIIDSILSRIYNGAKYGIFYETIRQVQMPDMTKFDIDGYALCPELKNYIKENLFLKKEEFDYNSINFEWFN